MNRHGTMRKKEEVAELTATEFRSLLLNSLNKLNNRDTVKNGFDELISIIRDLSPDDDSLNIFMNSILEGGESAISAYKKETLRIVASTASVHGEYLSAFLTRIISTIAKYLKDKDSSVRDICAECIGFVCRYIPAPPELRENSLGVFLKPFLAILAEHNKNHQIGAAQCLSAIIKNANEQEIVANLSRLVSRLQKLLNTNTCLARAQLLVSLTSLVEITRMEVIPYIPSIFALYSEGLSSSEWDARKAAAEGFQKIGTTLRDAIAPYKRDILDKLDHYKFDKIKPVRDAVNEALEVYTTILAAPDPSRDSLLATDTLRKTASRSRTLGAKELASFKGTMATGSPSGSVKLNKTVKSRAPVPHTIYVPAPPKTEGGGVLPPVHAESEDDFQVESAPQKHFTEAELDFQVESIPPSHIETRVETPKVLEQPRMETLRTSESLQQRKRSSTMPDVVVHDTNSITRVSSTTGQASTFPANSSTNSPAILAKSPANSDISVQLGSISETMNFILKKFDEFTSTTRQEIGLINQRLTTLETAVQQLKSQPAPAPAIVTERLATPAFVVSAPPPKEERSTSFITGSDTNAWNVALEHINIGNLDAAYSRILKDGDTLQLVRLLEQTGPCLDRIQPTTATQLFMRFIVFLKTSSFLDNVFPWIHQAIERAVVPLSGSQLSQLVKALGDLSASPQQHGIEAASLYDELRNITN